MYPKTPRFITCRQDYAALLGPPYRDRLTSQLRVITLLDAGVKGVRVDVEDAAYREHISVYWRRTV